MQFSNPQEVIKRKNSAGLSPEAKQWLHTLMLIAILPGTLLVIGIIILLSMAL